METLTNKRQHRGGDKQTLANKRRRRSDSPAAAGPAWLIMNSRIDDEGSAGNASVADDAKTTAASCTSSGKPFSVSFGVAAPPACCSLHFDWLGGEQRHGKHCSKSSDIRVIAGHDDTLLIQLRVPNNPNPATTFDYFLYEVGGGGGGGARWPPSLSRLPFCNIPMQLGYKNHRERTPRFRHLGMGNTGVLRRRGEGGGGGGDLVVCQLEMTCDPPIYDTAELCMLRIGGGRDREWINRRLPIVEHREGSSGELLLQPWRRQHFIAVAAVPVGNRFLCWVNYGSGFILCDMGMAAEEEETTPKLLRYVPLPPARPRHDGYCWPHGTRARCTLGAAGPDAVRFVSVSPPRCCGGAGASFSVTTWTMTLSTEEATAWVKDVELDCDEIRKWQLPNYGCLPCDKHLEYPMVSSDDPDVIYFKVEAMAVAAINTRSKKLLSVVPSATRDLHKDEEPPHLITAKLCW